MSSSLLKGQQQQNFVDPSSIVVSENESDLDKTIKEEVILWFNSFKSLKTNATRSAVERSHLTSLLKVPRSELMKVMVNLNLIELNTQDKMIMFDLNDSIFTIIYPESYKPLEGEGLMVTSDDPVLEKVVAKANRFIQRDHASMGSPSIAISVLLSKIVEIFVTKSFETLTPGVLNATDDIFGKKLQELNQSSSVEDDIEDDDDDDIIQTPTPQKVHIGEQKSIFDMHLEKDLSELIEKLQNVSQDEDFEMFRNAWGALASQYIEYSLTARKRILSELKLINPVNGRNGWRVDLVDGNIYVWTVSLFNFPTTSSIASGLARFKEKYQFGSDEVVLEIRFGNYPDEPPHLRVVSPRIQYLTGLVRFDGTICPEFMTKSNWNENKFLTIESIISKVKNILIDNDAKVDLRTFKHYDVKNALNSYVRQMRVLSIPSSNKFKEKYFIFSSAFSKRCFDVSVNLKALEKGNKVLLPSEAAAKIFEDPNVELPLIFEIETRHSQKIYCGVNEFSAPTGQIIVPEWMFNSLFITEGSKVSVRCVSLPPASSLKIQPHSKDFYNIINYKEVLESTLSKYSCVTEGQSLQVYDDDNNVHMIEIIETQPQPAVSVLSNGGFLEVEIDFVPAIDLDDPQELAQMQEKERENRIQKHEKFKQDVIKQTLKDRQTKKEAVQKLLSSSTTDKTVLVKFKFPDSSSCSQKFPVSASCLALYQYVECLDETGVWKPLPYSTSKELSLSTTFPKIDIPNNEKITLQSAGIIGQATIVVSENDRFPTNSE
ncbi:hypothetical protein C9374_002358 [Naegleria lovaniensis]|uniref:Uncharacterized protein n=1 Tax=Naegleria lovaniensis TaxID=51637 RepID=A0AA88GVR7_NAELO|nr:uncharacterized protein C9374_002358 [Naegleria lovaniensis]KAG2386614.1 hypothetical protein C9374_002358 [Naegleria lovaniensis]